MIGLIAGDIIGSVYERHIASTKDFPLFHPSSTYTDDSVLALAVAEAILSNKPYDELIREYGRKYPDACYGASFYRWMKEDNAPPYNSWGNGSAMRVASVGYASDTITEVMSEAKKSAEVTHNHPEGIKGAQAIALSVFLARKSYCKIEIRNKISDLFHYDMIRTVDDIRKTYHFDVSCQGSVPEAIISFLDSNSYEEAIRNAVFLGGDSDTIGAMAGAIAEAYYGGVPEKIKSRVIQILPDDLLDILNRFNRKYIPTS